MESPTGRHRHRCFYYSELVLINFARYNGNYVIAKESKKLRYAASLKKMTFVIEERTDVVRICYRTNYMVSVFRVEYRVFQ